MLVAIMRFPFGCCFDFHGCKHSSISNKSSPHRSGWLPDDARKDRHLHNEAVFLGDETSA